MYISPNKVLRQASIFSLLLLVGCSNAPTSEDLIRAKEKIEDKFNEMVNVSKDIPESIEGGYEDLGTLINEDYNWFQKKDITKAKFGTIRKMEQKLNRCKSQFEYLNSLHRDASSNVDKYFKMLGKNLKLINRKDLKINQKQRMDNVSVQLDTVLNGTKSVLYKLEAEISKYEEIVAFLRGDLALDMIGDHTISEMELISGSANSLILELQDYIEEGNLLISKM